MEVVWETQPKGVQVTHGMTQKFKLEICQNLIHALAWYHGSGLEE